MARRKTSPLSTRFASRRACSSCPELGSREVAFFVEQRQDPLAEGSKQDPHARVEHDPSLFIELLTLVAGHQILSSRVLGFSKFTTHRCCSVDPRRSRNGHSGFVRSVLNGRTS